MGTFVKGYWVVVLFVAVAVVRLRGDDLVNGTAAQAQGNTNSSSPSVLLKHPPGKGNGRGRDKGSIGRNQAHRKRVFNKEDYKMGEFAQCTVRGRCRGMRLDCPLHCGGPCVYDCQHMCKAHCRRP
ncbi:hypothetical protein GOBAR_DD22287 [Gossypium barbadense]|nr:hypothetical protein GOBAR_DD22287 [Gossypium barbadense]